MVWCERIWGPRVSIGCPAVRAMNITMKSGSYRAYRAQGASFEVATAKLYSRIESDKAHDLVISDSTKCVVDKAQ